MQRPEAEDSDQNAQAQAVEPDPAAWATGPLSLLFALCAALAVMGVLGEGVVGDSVQRWAAAPILFGGFAFPLLLRATPGPASPLKLFLFASLLSPVLMTAVEGSMRWLWASALDPASSQEALAKTTLAATFGLAAALQLFGRGRRLKRERLGTGAVVGLVLALGAGLWTAAVLLDGSATRVSFHGLLHSGLALSTGRDLPPANPWLADQPLGYYWAWHALGGVTLRSLALAPTVAFAWLGVWAALLSVLALQAQAAVLFRSAPREVLGVVFGVLGLNALGGLWLLSGAGWPEGAPLTNAELLSELRTSLVPTAGGELLWDPRVAFGPSKFGNLSSYPAALALALGGFAAAAHAVRHGHRLWTGLCAATVGASLALNPLVGASAAGVIGAAAFVAAASPRARFEVSVALLIGALPGILLVRAAAQAYTGAPVSLDFDARRLASVLGPWALMAVPAGFGLWTLLREIDRDDPRRAVLWLTVFAVVANGLVAALAVLPYANEYKFVRIGAFPLGLLAAAGVWRGGGWSTRSIGVACAVPLLIGAWVTNGVGSRAYLALAARDLPLEESAGRLLPSAGSLPSAGDTRAVYEWLSSDPTVRAARPVLLLDLSGPTGERFGVDEASGGGFSFTSAQNLQAHEAAAFGAVDLFVDRPSQVLAGGDAIGVLRRDVVERLFSDPQDWNDASLRPLFESERPLLVWVGPQQRRRHRGFSTALEQRGFEKVHEAGEIQLFVAAGPGYERWRGAFDAIEGERGVDDGGVR